MTLVKKRNFDVDGLKRSARNARARIRGDSSPADEAARSTASDAGRRARAMAGETLRAARNARTAAKEARSKARTAANETRSKARTAAKDSRKNARRQWVRARVAAARATAPQRGASKKAVAGAGAAGVAGAYFLDPNEGRRRRHVVRDRTLALLRRGSERARREAEYRKTQAEGKVEAAKSVARPEKPAANDQQLAERVKSEIFQPADAPKGTVNVNVEHGIVYLRGEADPGQAEKLVKEARAVDGVKGVENLLNQPVHH
jgi:osmotically-inducible protein OsmY